MTMRDLPQWAREQIEELSAEKKCSQAQLIIDALGLKEPLQELPAWAIDQIGRRAAAKQCSDTELIIDALGLKEPPEWHATLLAAVEDMASIDLGRACELAELPDTNFNRAQVAEVLRLACWLRMRRGKQTFYTNPRTDLLEPWEDRLEEFAATTEAADQPLSVFQRAAGLSGHGGAVLVGQWLQARGWKRIMRNGQWIYRDSKRTPPWHEAAHRMLDGCPLLLLREEILYGCGLEDNRGNRSDVVAFLRENNWVRWGRGWFWNTPDRPSSEGSSMYEHREFVKPYFARIHRRFRTIEGILQTLSLPNMLRLREHVEHHLRMVLHWEELNGVWEPPSDWKCVGDE
jgi:hypothetical protein